MQPHMGVITGQCLSDLTEGLTVRPSRAEPALHTQTEFPVPEFPATAFYGSQTCEADLQT